MNKDPIIQEILKELKHNKFARRVQFEWKVYYKLKRYEWYIRKFFSKFSKKYKKEFLIDTKCFLIDYLARPFRDESIAEKAKAQIININNQLEEIDKD